MRVLDQETLEPFTRDEEARILEAARGIGHDWHGVCAVGGTPTVTAGSGAAVNIGSRSATAGGDCSSAS